MSWGNIIGLAIVGILVIVLAVNFKRVVGWFGSSRKFFREVAAEMRNVAWPTQDEVINQTILVGITIVIFVLIVGFSDYVFGQIVGMIFNFE